MSGQPGSAVNHGAFTRVEYAESRRNHRGQGFRGRKNTCGGKYLPTPLTMTMALGSFSATAFYIPWLPWNLWLSIGLKIFYSGFTLVLPWIF